MSGPGDTGWSSNMQHSLGVRQEQPQNGTSGMQILGSSQPEMHHSQLPVWSDNISGKNSGNMGNQNSSSGWSHSIGSNYTGVVPSGIGTNTTVMGQVGGTYSQQTQYGNMGMGPANLSTGTGRNWSSGGMAQQQQPMQPPVVGVSSLTPQSAGQGQQPLIPGPGLVTGSSDPYQAGCLVAQQHQAPGANPFADLSFLS